MKQVKLGLVQVMAALMDLLVVIKMWPCVIFQLEQVSSIVHVYIWYWDDKVISILYYELNYINDKEFIKNMQKGLLPLCS